MGDTAPTPMLDIGPRIGCDVVNVVDVTRSIELFGRRYLDRTFTPHELQTCAGPARDQRLAARFAAKEAVVKVPAAWWTFPFRGVPSKSLGPSGVAVG